MNRNDETYFEAYTDLEVHEKMLCDNQRNEAYRNAIILNQDYFRNKIVLDIGTGTGILSVLCAKVGAAKVYAVEASNITSITKRILKENQVQDVVEIIEGKVEQVKLPEKVDIIISEWMGFYLIHEGMLGSVIYARDKFLKNDGVLFPYLCKLYIAPCTLSSYFLHWSDVQGVQMNSFGIELRKLYAKKPKIMTIDSKNLLNDGSCAYEMLLKYITIDELEKISYKLLTCSRVDGMYQGICIWFDVVFPCMNKLYSKEIILSTAPDKPKTHWKQTVLLMQDDIEVEEGSPIFGMITLKKSSNNSRFYDIEFEILDPESENHPIPCHCYFTKCKIIKALSNKYDERDEKVELTD